MLRTLAGETPQVAADGTILNLKSCDWKWRDERGPRHRGFFNGKVANPDWVSMGLVLASLALHRGSAVQGDIIKTSGLRPGAVDSALSRAFKGTRAVERSSVTVPTIPVGRGYVYRLSQKGRDVLRWVIRSGRVRLPEGHDLDTVLSGARQNPRGLKFIRRE